MAGVDWPSFGNVADPGVWSQVHDEGAQVLENMANIRVPDPGKTYDQNQNVDISVRPIVYTNDLLYEIILAMKQGPSSTSARKP